MKKKIVKDKNLIDFSGGKNKTPAQCKKVISPDGRPVTSCPPPDGKVP